MPSIAADGPRSETAARVVRSDADGAGVFDGDAAGMGRMTVALLQGATEVRTTDVAAAERVKAVVDRLLRARDDL